MGQKGCRLASSGQVMGIISLVAFSFMVQLPSAIMLCARDRSLRRHAVDQSTARSVLWAGLLCIDTPGLQHWRAAQGKKYGVPLLQVARMLQHSSSSRESRAAGVRRAPVLQALEVAQHLVLAVVQVEDGRLQEGTGALEGPQRAARLPSTHMSGVVTVLLTLIAA